MPTAEQLNEGQRKRRQTAAEAQPAVVDVEAQRRKDEELDEWINMATLKILGKREERQSINADIQAVITEAKSRGLAVKSFKRKVAEYAMDESKRLAEEATSRRMNQAFKWTHLYEQADFFKAGDQENMSLKGDTLDQQDAAGKKH